MDPSSSPDKMAEVRSLLKEGNKIAAIKEYRRITGAGLAEAKEAVEAMPLDPNAPSASANLPTNAARKGGCLGMLAVAGILAAAGWWLSA